MFFLFSLKVDHVNLLYNSAKGGFIKKHHIRLLLVEGRLLHKNRNPSAIIRDVIMSNH